MSTVLVGTGLDTRHTRLDIGVAGSSNQAQNECRGKDSLAIVHLKLLSFLTRGTINLTEPPREQR